jgi:tRNA threonylcarbamoyladenosine biosynthesis protein TsaB
MTITFCIETSGAHCSLAIAVDEQIYEADRELHRTHNLHLLPMVDELFEQAGVRATDVELVAFGCGPGSFTGVRIAAAVSQAIALAANAAVLPVASSTTLAVTAAAEVEAANCIVSCIASRGTAFYLSCFDRTLDAPVPVTQVHADELVQAPPAWLSARLPETHVTVGALPDWFPASLREKFVQNLYPRARCMLRVAADLHGAGASGPPETGLPHYVAGDSPWRKQT